MAGESALRGRASGSVRMIAPSEATPRPWRLSPDLRIGSIQIIAEQGPVTVCPASVHGGPADADLIVRAVNAHDDLIWAAKDAALCIAAILGKAGQDRASSPTLTHLMRAIKQAEGKL